MKTYAGFCYDSGGWGGDLTGLLLVKEGNGWVQVTGHISSDVMWSERDIRGHFDRRDNPDPGDTFEWAGRLSMDDAAARFTPASEVESVKP